MCDRKGYNDPYFLGGYFQPFELGQKWRVVRNPLERPRLVNERLASALSRTQEFSQEEVIEFSDATWNPDSGDDNPTWSRKHVIEVGHLWYEPFYKGPPDGIYDYLFENHPENATWETHWKWWCQRIDTPLSRRVTNIYSDHMQAPIYTPLMLACREQSHESVLALIKAGANLDVATDFVPKDDSDPNTALIIALQGSDPSIPLTLIKHGADVYLSTRDGFSPLMIAAFQGHAQCVEELLKKGARVNDIDNEKGQTALMFAANPMGDPDEEASEHIPSGALHRRLVQIVMTLLDHEADRFISTPSGKTAADLATDRRLTAIVALLQ